MKKLTIYLSLPLFMYLSVAMIRSESALASTASPSTSCTLNGGSFFGFPTWYKYLQGTPSTVDTGNSNSPTPVTTCSPKFQGLSDVWLIVAAVIDMLLYVAGFGAVIMVIYGGVRYTTSMGSPEATAQAKNTIIYALIGLIIAISASFLVTFIATTVLGSS